MFMAEKRGSEERLKRLCRTFLFTFLSKAIRMDHTMGHGSFGMSL